MPLHRRGAWLTAAVVVLLVVGLMVWRERDRVVAVATGAPPPGDGVFVSSNDGVATSSYSANTNTYMVFGQNVLRNTGTRPLELTTGRLIGDVPTSAAQVVEVRAIVLPEHGDLVGAAPWPFERLAERSLPVGEVTLGAHEQAEILYVVKILKPGKWHWKQTEMRYTSGGHTHSARTDWGFAACAPTNRSCVG